MEALLKYNTKTAVNNNLAVRKLVNTASFPGSPAGSSYRKQEERITISC